MNPLFANEMSSALDALVAAQVGGGPTDAATLANQAVAQMSLDGVFHVTEDSSLVDVMRARDRGVPLELVAKFFRVVGESFERSGQNLYRRTLVSATGPTATVLYPRENIEREMIILASNNYLGLATHPKVVAAATEAVQKYGTGVCSAPLLIGTLPITNELEQNLASFKGTEDAVVFSSGYGANVGMISALATKNDLVVMDRLAHASIIDGATLSGAKVRVFKHNDAEHLDRILSRYTEHPLRLVVVEGLYSMDGDIAPLPEIADVCDKHGAWLIVDEAHTLGVLGPNGEGAVGHFGLKGRAKLQIGTMSKSLGCTGGFVAGSADIINYIRYFGRSNMFSAAPTPMALATANAALNVIREEPELREKLWKNTHFLYNQLKARGFRLSDYASPVIPVIVGKMSYLRQMNLELHNNNICVNSIPYPAVSHGEERLRLSVMATHTEEQLMRAVLAIETAGKNAGVI